MKTIPSLLLAALFLTLPSSCRSPQADLPCRCGTPMADLEGCAHSSCMAGQSNPDNPDCVCGKLDIPSGK